jgi:carboxypeptidase Taq
MTNIYETYLERVKEWWDLETVGAVLSWDQNTYMPDGGAKARASQLATIKRLWHEKLTGEEMGEAHERVKEAVVSEDPDSVPVRLVQWMDQKIEKERKVSSDWVAEFEATTALGFQTWVKARENSDFEAFKPYLQKIVDLRRAYADFFQPYDHVYDPLLDYFERGMKTEEVKQVFEEIRPVQVELLQAIQERDQVDNSFLHQPFEHDAQWDFGIEVTKALGYDFKRGRQDLSAHPFTTTFSIGDVRITTRVDPNYFGSMIFSCIHEAGHAMYEQGMSMELEGTPLADGTSMSIHESQSRMMENLIGRSRAFWKAYLPRLRTHFPGQFDQIDLDTFYKGINRVEPSLIRVEADEATYNLHIMLRFEIEIALMEGNLAVNDLPTAWNDKMQEYLNLTPTNDAEGVLQDVHWSSGYIGYFPTYALGNLVASQLWDRILQDLPDVEAQIERTEFAPLLEWLGRKIHQHGSKFPPMELLERVTGTGLVAEPYIAYLKGKYGEIYGLDG